MYVHSVTYWRQTTLFFIEFLMYVSGDRQAFIFIFYLTQNRDHFALKTPQSRRTYACIGGNQCIKIQLTAHLAATACVF